MRTCLIASYKGGVSKTVTTANVGAALADRGYRVLLVDLDPAGHLTESFSALIPEGDFSSADLIDPDRANPPTPMEASVRVGKNLSLVMSDSQPLEVCELRLDRDSIEGPFALRKALKPAQKTYDIALVDIPPRLTSLTVNALVAADAAVALVPPQTLSFYGAQSFHAKVAQVAESPLNPQLRFLGALYTMVNADAEETQLIKQAVRDIGWPSFKEEIPYSLLASKAASRGIPAVWEFPKRGLSKRYRDVAGELLKRLDKAGVSVSRSK